VGYGEAVCRLGEVEGGGGEVSRCNADTKGEDCNRSEGKVFILATVHDTFEKPERETSFWVSFASLDAALAFRKEVCLDNAKDLPVSVEYMDRDSVDVIDRSGRVLANVIKVVGMASPMVGVLWDIKLWVESLGFTGSDLICDRFLHVVNPLMPEILPKRMMESAMAMDHHVAMTVGDFGDGEMERCLERMNNFQKKYGTDVVTVHECDGTSEEESLSAFRFVAAPAFRTWCVGENAQGISVDYALPKNGGQAPSLGDAGVDSDATATSSAGPATPLKRMRYSHFGCNVVHEDLAYPLGVDVHAAKYALKRQVEQKSRGKLPAEHGHGTEYDAPKETQDRWKRMDPLNVMNPGIGGLNSNPEYIE